MIPAMSCGLVWQQHLQYGCFDLQLLLQIKQVLLPRHTTTLSTRQVQQQQQQARQRRAGVCQNHGRKILMSAPNESPLQTLAKLCPICMMNLPPNPIIPITYPIHTLSTMMAPLGSTSSRSRTAAATTCTT